MTFSENDIPDLTGKIIIVTGVFFANITGESITIYTTLYHIGGNSGIGKQTVAVLASKGAKVYLAARSEVKYKQALDEIHTSHLDSTKGQIEYLQLDLSTAKSAKEAAENFKSYVLCVI